MNPEEVACFSSPNPDRQLPSFHQQSTTTSPPKNHVQPSVFAKTPAKNSVPPPPKNSHKSSPYSGRFFPPPGMTKEATTLSLVRVKNLAAAQSAQTLRQRRMVQRYPKTQANEVSPEKLASPKSPILWGFSRVPRGIKAERNYAWTCWRARSHSNSS
jgi:hypothetical protein